MMTYLADWLALLVRWLHLIAGIAWIGASFYFVWLDNHLQPPRERDDDLAGELWAVHGGGFYVSQKYRIAPRELPATLHWFYWEAYTTWLSGFALLCLLYFLRAEAYLIDPGVAALSKPAAIAMALAMLAGAWLLYDAVCRSPLQRRPGALGLVLALLFCLEAFALCHLFSGRGAFILFGSSLGTIMVANVLFVIIPGQRELVRAKCEQRQPDPTPGLRGKQRSVHNTYLTLPVLFVMISNHYPITFGARDNWLVLIAMSVAGAGIRAWFVARHRQAQWRPWALAAAVIAALCIVAVATALAPRAGSRAEARGAVDTEELARVQSIVEQRCVPCHATHPTQAGFTAGPNGVVLESLDELMRHLPQVQQQLATRAMPLGNLTSMTPDERVLFQHWADRALASAR
ncbi:MAG TPA: urate hydroxylase PuuD, partial [Steroidobacteraceae bacterium]|nr:urate hydroxylase PuuD [Steroidobacteraceae bacterium]